MKAVGNIISFVFICHCSACLTTCLSLCLFVLNGTPLNHVKDIFGILRGGLFSPQTACLAAGGCQCGGPSSGHYCVCCWSWHWDHHLRADIHRQQTIVHLRAVCWRLHHHRSHPRLHGAEALWRWRIMEFICMIHHLFSQCTVAWHYQLLIMWLRLQLPRFFSLYFKSLWLSGVLLCLACTCWPNCPPIIARTYEVLKI